MASFIFSKFKTKHKPSPLMADPLPKSPNENSTKLQNLYDLPPPIPAMNSTKVTEELKELYTMALPITAMNCLVFLRAAISVLFLGRLGRLELAGGALSIGFTNITGYSVMAGLATGLEPVCSQAHGSGNRQLSVVSLQRMILILAAAAVPISALWLNLEPIAVAAGQDRRIAAVAAAYCRYSIPDLAANTVLQPLRVFLRCQRVVKPMVYCSLAAVVLHAPLNVVLGRGMGGVAAVATAAAVTNVNMLGLMTGYVWYRGEVGWWWCGVRGLVGGSVDLLRVAVPSCVGVCLEWWWYEIVTVLAGYLPDPTAAVAATGVLIQTTGLMYTVPMALAASVSTRVGNELGAGRPERAKVAAVVAVGCAAVIGVGNVVWTVVFRKRWAELFTEDEAVKALVASVMPLIGICELGNCPQTTGCGVLRATARPVIAARINLWSFYAVGTPVAVGLAFSMKLGFSGLWFGLLSAQIACAVCILYTVLTTDWESECRRANQIAEHREMAVLNGKDSFVNM